MLMRQGFLFDDVGFDPCIFIGIDVQITEDADRRRALQLALLEALLRSPTGLATTDDTLRDLSVPIPGGGKWMGPAVIELGQDGLIQSVGAVNSRRKTRNGSLIHIWKGLNLAAVTRQVKRLRSYFDLDSTIGSAGEPTEPSS